MPAGAAVEPSDDALLDRLQREAFDYFLQTANPQNGLIGDTTRNGAPSSIAVVGFALSEYAVGVEHGWIQRVDAVQRTLVTLRFFMGSDQSGGPEATGHRLYVKEARERGIPVKTFTLPMHDDGAKADAGDHRQRDAAHPGTLFACMRAPSPVPSA